jgi:mitochondrial fission protein ELM1
LRAALQELALEHRGFFWDGSGENPYVAFLALAEAVVATADSFNMIGEAVAAGCPILVFEPSGGHMKLKAFVESLEKQGAVHMFDGRLAGERYAPIDATPMIADAIAGAFARHRRALGLEAVSGSESF